MAVDPALLAKAEQIRDESNVGANTASRVGGLFVDIVEALGDNDDTLGVISQYLEDYMAKLGEDGILDWKNSPVVFLVSMGADLDGDGGAVISDGDLYYYNQGGYQIREKQGGGSTGYAAKENVLYINKYTGNMYRWDGADMVQIGGSGGSLTYTEDETTIYVTTDGYVDNTPRISVAPNVINLSPAIGDTVTRSIVVRGYNLTTPITISLTDGSGFYSLDRNTLPVEGGTVVLTYHPTSGGTHNATISIRSGADAEGSVAVSGIAATPTITVDNDTLTMASESGQSSTAQFHVTGVSLADVINIAVSGAGFSVYPSIISVNDAVDGVDVEVTFDGSADSGSATITLSSTGAASVTVSATYTAVQPASVGEEVGNVAGLKFLVTHNTLTPGDSNEVSVQKASTTISGNIVIPSTVTDANGISYSVTSLADKAFQSCSYVTGITIPASVTKRDGVYHTFSGCSSLTQIDFGGLKSIGEYGMENCSSLQTVILPDTMTSVGGNCFIGCTSLHTIQIGTSSACQMSSLQQSLQNACQSNANTKNSALRTIICYATTPPSFGLYASGYGYGLPTTFFNYNGDPGNGTLYVRNEAKSSYETTALWKEIPTIDDITE